MYMYTCVHTLCYVTLGTDGAQLESADTEIFDDIHLPQVPPSKTTPDGVTWGKSIKCIDKCHENGWNVGMLLQGLVPGLVILNYG